MARRPAIRRRSPKPALTPKQSLFVTEYLRDLNASRAAVAVGYSKKSAHRLGHRMLKTKEVAAAIDAAKLARAKAAEIDAEWVLRNLRAMFERVAQESTPALDRKGKPMRDGDGNPVYKFDAANALRSLELIGKHVTVQAFREQIEVTPSSAVIAALLAGRRRAAGHVIPDPQISERKLIDG